MRGRIFGAALALILAGGAWAQEARAPDPGIEGTIRSQIDAFLQDDFTAAFEFAAPNIRQIFRTPENFGAMVRNGYPMVWRPEDLRFGPLREIEGRLWQRVLVTDVAGKSFVLEYEMREVAGDWRIAGVRVIPAPGISA